MTKDSIEELKWEGAVIYFFVWHKTIWKGHWMRLELTRVGLLVENVKFRVSFYRFICKYYFFSQMLSAYVNLFSCAF